MVVGGLQNQKRLHWEDFVTGLVNVLDGLENGVLPVTESGLVVVSVSDFLRNWVSGPW